MDENLFKYHRHLQAIANEDVEFLKKKDRSYGASWKRSGRSAWFMLKRMMDRLDAMMARRGVRPTLLQPFWNVAGFALGAATAALGPEAAMACTAAVETEIDRHYGASRHRAGAWRGARAGLSGDVGGDPAELPRRDCDRQADLRGCGP